MHGEWPGASRHFRCTEGLRSVVEETMTLEDLYRRKKREKGVIIDVKFD